MPTSDPYDSWLPFRRQLVGSGGDAVTGRIRREVIKPLEALLAKTSDAEAGIPGPLRESLETVLGVVSESFAAADSAGSVETLDQAWQGWELKLQAFSREGGEVQMQRLGKQPALGVEASRQLFLAVREAIGNAMRHAAARRIELMLVPWKRGCAVTLADNGRGMPESTAGGGIGLASMRRRMARCGGELLVHPADGTVVEFRLPSPDFDCWQWLRESGRIGNGVAPEHADGLIRKWQQRVDRCGEFEAIFRTWPRAAADDSHADLDSGSKVPAEWAQVPDWIARRVSAMGLAETLESSSGPELLRIHVGADDDADPLHWLDLAMDLSRVWPVMLGRTEVGGVEIIVAGRSDLLPLPEPGNSYAWRVHEAWSGGIADLQADLSSYLHDVLAQELVAESMRWEIAREACPPSALRSRFDQCQHELRRIAMLARSLSHELAEG
jgi:Histidine kinase-, DNA gyrase B-, and HSP90-like ATPase